MQVRTDRFALRPQEGPEFLALGLGQVPAGPHERTGDRRSPAGSGSLGRGRILEGRQGRRRDLLALGWRPGLAFISANRRGGWRRRQSLRREDVRSWRSGRWDPGLRALSVHRCGLDGRGWVCVQLAPAARDQPDQEEVEGGRDEERHHKRPAVQDRAPVADSATGASQGARASARMESGSEA